MNNHILIAEDELITGTQLAELLSDEGYSVIGPARSAGEAIALCEKNSPWPDVAICDIQLAGNIKGTELAQTLKERFATEIIFLTAYADPKTLDTAFGTSPVMYLVKPYTPLQLLVAVQMAFYKAFERKKLRTESALQLTTRETEIISLIAKGMTTRQIAQKTGLSTETIKTHRKNILRKNGISSIPQLIYLMNQ